MLQITRLSKNLLLIIDIAKSDKVGIISGGADYKNEIIKRSPFKNLNKAATYLTPKARLPFTQLRKMFIKILIF